MEHSYCQTQMAELELISCSHKSVVSHGKQYQYRWNVEGLSKLPADKPFEGMDFKMDFAGDCNWKLTILSYTREYKRSTYVYVVKVRVNCNGIRPPGILFRCNLHDSLSSSCNFEETSVPQTFLETKEYSIDAAKLESFTICCDFQVVEIKHQKEDGPIPVPDIPSTTENSYIGNLLNSEKFSDLVIKVGKESFKCHRIVLSMSSEVFENMLLSDMKEKTEKVIKIDDVDSAIFKKFLEFLYFEQFDEACKEDLLYLAEKYDVKNLKLRCEKELIDAISIDTVLKYLSLANRYNSSSLKGKCFQFVNENYGDVVKKEEFLEFIKGESELMQELQMSIAQKFWP